MCQSLSVKGVIASTQGRNLEAATEAETMEGKHTTY